MARMAGDMVIPDLDLTGKVAVVTGGTKGLGRGIALTFAAYGADVVVASRTAGACEKVAGELRELGVRSAGIPTDITQVEACDQLVRQSVETMGKIDIMVCGAGASGTSFATEMTEKDWDFVMDLDLKSVFFSARAAARQMIDQGHGGRIIVISSSAAFTGRKGLSHYCAAKAGANNLVKALAAEWGKFGITVNAVCPGYVPTDMNAQALANPKVRAGIENGCFVRRLGRVEEIALPVLMCASDYAGYMTGASILVNGGT